MGGSREDGGRKEGGGQKDRRREGEAGRRRGSARLSVCDKNYGI